MICMLADIWMSWQHLRSIGMLHSQNRLLDDGEGTLVVRGATRYERYTSHSDL